MLTIRRYVEANGYEVVRNPAEAEIIVVGTCAFKSKEEGESVGRIRFLRKFDSKIIVYGCLPDIAGDRYPEFDDLPSVAPREIEKIATYIEGASVPFSAVPEAHVLERGGIDLGGLSRRIGVGLASPQEMLYQIRVMGPKRLRQLFSPTEEPYYLFVSRGCVGSCSFCAIPRSIGRVASKSVDAVLAEFRTGLDAGFRTYLVLGDDPGCYGLDISTSLPQLMRELFEYCDVFEAEAEGEADGKAAIRFHIREIHPKFLVRYHEEILALPGASRIEEILCPVQSGNDRVLRLMRRQHSSGELLRAVQAIHRTAPSVRLTTQMIVGFPTETPDEFQDTLDFVKAGGFESVVVFPYDDKQGTVASALSDKIAPKEITARVDLAFRYFRAQGIEVHPSCP
jgi:threonylcarbamoyladenosine tRNA methylthiotransferase MtaB